MVKEKTDMVSARITKGKLFQMYRGRLLPGIVLAVLMIAAFAAAATFTAEEADAASDGYLAGGNIRHGKYYYMITPSTYGVISNSRNHKLRISKKKTKNGRVIVKNKTKKKLVYNGDAYFHKNRIYYSYTKFYGKKYKRIYIYSMSLSGKDKKQIFKSGKLKCARKKIILVMGHTVLMRSYSFYGGSQFSIDTRTGRVVKQNGPQYTYISFDNAYFKRPTTYNGRWALLWDADNGEGENGSLNLYDTYNHRTVKIAKYINDAFFKHGRVYMLYENKKTRNAALGYRTLGAARSRNIKTFKNTIYGNSSFGKVGRRSVRFRISNASLKYKYYRYSFATGKITRVKK